MADDFKKNLEDLNNTPDTTDQFSQDDIEQNKLMAILAYLNLLVLIPIFAAKNSPFARFHCNQGLILLILTIAVNVLDIAIFIIPNFVWNILKLLILILAVLGIYNAFSGKAKELPLVGGIKLIQ